MTRRSLPIRPSNTTRTGSSARLLGGLALAGAFALGCDVDDDTFVPDLPDQLAGEGDSVVQPVQPRKPGVPDAGGG